MSGKGRNIEGMMESKSFTLLLGQGGEGGIFDDGFKKFESATKMGKKLLNSCGLNFEDPIPPVNERVLQWAKEISKIVQNLKFDNEFETDTLKKLNSSIANTWDFLKCKAKVEANTQN